MNNMEKQSFLAIVHKHFPSQNITWDNDPLIYDEQHEMETLLQEINSELHSNLTVQDLKYISNTRKKYTWRDLYEEFLHHRSSKNINEGNNTMPSQNFKLLSYEATLSTDNIMDYFDNAVELRQHDNNHISRSENIQVVLNDLNSAINQATNDINDANNAKISIFSNKEAIINIQKALKSVQNVLNSTTIALTEEYRYLQLLSYFSIGIWTLAVSNQQNIDSLISKLQNKLEDASKRKLLDHEIKQIEQLLSELNSLKTLYSKINDHSNKLKKIEIDFYTKGEVDSKFTDVYTKGEVDSKFTDVYTKSEVDSKFTDIYTKGEVDNKFTDVYTKEEVDNKFTEVYTKEEVDNKFAEVYAKNEVDGKFKNFWIVYGITTATLLAGLIASFLI